MTEQELLALYEQRDQRAIQETETTYGRYLSKVAGAVLSSREDVEECLNDTWLRAWNSIPPDKPKYFRAYLSRIVKNLALSLFRKQHAEKRCNETFQLARSVAASSISLHWMSSMRTYSRPARAPRRRRTKTASRPALTAFWKSSQRRSGFFSCGATSIPIRFRKSRFDRV